MYTGVDLYITQCPHGSLMNICLKTKKNNHQQLKIDLIFHRNLRQKPELLLVEGQNTAASDQSWRGGHHTSRSEVPPRSQEQRGLRRLRRPLGRLQVSQEGRRHLGRGQSHQGARQEGRGMDGSSHVWYVYLCYFFYLASHSV